MALIKAILVVLAVTGCSSLEILKGSSLLPIEMYDYSGKAIVMSPLPSDKCCGQLLTFTNNLAKINLKDCRGTFRCESEGSIQRDLTQTGCPVGIMGSSGCVTISEVPTDVTVRCLCTSEGTQCPFAYLSNVCTTGSKFSMNDEEQLIITPGANLTFQGALKDHYIQPTKCRVEKVKMNMTEKGKIRFEAYSKEECSCLLTLKNKVSRISCKGECVKEIEVGLEGETRVNAKVVCGETTTDFWLFRGKSKMEAMYGKGIKMSFLESHGMWREHSQLCSTLLLATIIIGYPFIRIMVGLVFVIFRIYRLVYHKHVSSMFHVMFSWLSNNEDVCLACGVDFKCAEDSMLHSELCYGNNCVYCGVSDPELFHISGCWKRDGRIEEFKKELRLMDKEKMNEEMDNWRNNFWVNEYTRQGRPTKIWIGLIVALLLLTLAAPNNALKDFPCSKQKSKSNCKVHENSPDAGNDAEAHLRQSLVELGYEGNLNTEFNKHSIDRMKVDNAIFKSNSAKTITGNVIRCRDGVCAMSATMDIAGQIESGFVQSYEVESEGKEKTTLNFAITEVELSVNLFPQYKTMEWELQNNPGFECTGDNCNSCPECPKNAFCKRKEEKQSTSWFHNPLWCLSISSGCSCITTFMTPKLGSNLYQVFKTGTPTVKATLCIETNNDEMDCIKIDRVGMFKTMSSKIEVVSWEPERMSERQIVVDRGFGEAYNDPPIVPEKFCDLQDCKLGNLGDYQVTTLSGDPKLNAGYADVDAIEQEIKYNFGKEPEWEVKAPGQRIKRMSTERRHELADRANINIDLMGNKMVLKERNAGSFAIKVSMLKLKVYEVLDHAELKEFKVESCVGEYMSQRGCYCTFSIEVDGAQETLINLDAEEDNILMVDDQQLVKEGKNVFKKFFYTRAVRTSYDFCAKTEKSKICTSVKNNFTEPTVNWAIVHGNSMTKSTASKPTKCDYWLGIDCIYDRFTSLIKTFWSASIIILLGLGACYGLHRGLQWFQTGDMVERAQKSTRVSIAAKRIKERLMGKKKKERLN